MAEDQIRLEWSDDGDLCLRVGVRAEDGSHSTVFRLWSNRTSGAIRDDIYIASRSIAGAMKASLHASGRRQVSFTSQYHRKDPSQRIALPPDRHIRTWTSGLPICDGVSLEFILRFPEGQLRNFPARKEDEVTWIALPNSAPGIELLLYIIEPGINYSITLHEQTTVFGHGLPDGRYFMITVRIVKDALRIEADVAGQVRAALGGLPTEPGHRLLVLFATDQQVPGWADYAADFVSVSTVDGDGSQETPIA